VLRDAEQMRVLRLLDGYTVWAEPSPTPIAGIEIVGDLVLVAADSLTAYVIADRTAAWQASLRGARIGVTRDRRTIVAATEQGITALDLRGRLVWESPLPESVRTALPDQLTTGEDAAFVTFRPRGEPAIGPPIDVLGIALR
jgi:hypothetical protein